MRRIQSVRELNPQFQQLLRLEGPPGDAVLQRLTLQDLQT
jgi:hypothetical protein